MAVDDKTGANKNPDDKKTVSIDEFKKLKEQLEAKSAELENTKKAQSGSDSKVTELEQKLEDMQKKFEEQETKAANEKLSVTEQLTKQMQEIKDELKTERAEKQRKEFLNSGYKEAIDRNLPAALVDNYGGSPDGLVEYLDTMKTEIESRTNKEINNKLKNGHKPSGAKGENQGEWNPDEHRTDGETFSQANMDHYIKEAEKRVTADQST